jgi:hypothetical protein
MQIVVERQVGQVVGAMERLMERELEKTRIALQSMSIAKGGVDVKVVSTHIL